MLLVDSETKVDLLNNEGIAKTVVKLLHERPEQPITIGIHGDWGAGKSSVLEMIEASMEADKDVVCIKFNGWSFQGFEDAKIALIEGIVTELIDKRSLKTKAADEVKDTLKRIDILKLAKLGGNIAWTAVTGVPSPDIIQSAKDTLQKWMGDPGALATKENIQSVIGNLGGALKQKEERRIPQEIQEFRKSFGVLLDHAKIKRLVVLIDDLDRCLPETAIQTLEAMRLLLFADRTAFVIGSDEQMITYAARQHFPNLPAPQDYARNYLEKLIQVPFKLPALGEMETRIYVSLLLIGSVVGEETEDFRKIFELGRERMKTPWKAEPIDAESVFSVIGRKDDDITEMISISDQVGPLLATGTDGNPRQIKRFLNALLLRKNIADARGFGDEVNLLILAKLMLAERFISGLFKDIAIDSARSSDGQSLGITELEVVLAGNKKRAEVETDMVQYLDQDDALHWVSMLPQLQGIDLRPYFFVAKDSRDYSMGNPVLERLSGMIEQLNAKRIINRTSLTDEIARLTSVDAKVVFDEIKRLILGKNYAIKPDGAEGLKLLVSLRPELEQRLIGLLQELKPQRTGAWAVGLANATVISEEGKRQLLDIEAVWTSTGSSALKNALKGSN